MGLWADNGQFQHNVLRGSDGGRGGLMLHLIKRVELKKTSRRGEAVEKKTTTKKNQQEQGKDINTKNDKRTDRQTRLIA